VCVCEFVSVCVCVFCVVCVYVCVDLHTKCALQLPHIYGN